jgi:hypothetical protein
MTHFAIVVCALVLGGIILLVSLLGNAHRRIRELQKQNEHQANRHAEACHNYGRQVELRNGVIKNLLHEKLAPETLAFFIHLSDPSSHIPDSVFDKVASYQEHVVAKKKKEE